MLEDSLALENAVTEPADSTEPMRPTGTDCSASGTPASHSSAFASFSGVRKGLYELCLAQLVDVRTAGFRSSTAIQDDHSRDRSMAVTTEGLLNNSAENSDQGAVRGFQERCAASASGGSAVLRREPQTAAASWREASAASTLAPAPALPRAPATPRPTTSPPPQAVAASAAAPLGSSEVVAGGSDTQHQRGDTARRSNENDALGPRAAVVIAGRRHDPPPRRVTREGDEYVVREFRRVRAGVKAFRVVCKVSRERYSWQVANDLDAPVRPQATIMNDPPVVFLLDRRAARVAEPSLNVASFCPPQLSLDYREVANSQHTRSW